MSRSSSPVSDADSESGVTPIDAQLLLLHENISATIQHNLKFALQPNDEPPHQLSSLYERRRQLTADVAHFWLTVLLSHPAFMLLITADDSKLLRSLRDVHVSDSSPAQFEIRFEFERNHVFKDQYLRKRYIYSEHTGRVVINDTPTWLVDRPPVSGFCAWLVSDTRDSSLLGELFKQHVYPNAIDLYFGNFSLSDSDDDLIALNAIR
eukprot:TRINITY_DN922_c0_g1_i1.p2 TRINITY_DN922_c0_g1~~TRINITY_DN922_c0_g1_i1.p2  ORF type:complete len:208 (+),score=42.43 TRINITY_DN922_c0_g1_i1:516-1139(+)